MPDRDKTIDSLKVLRTWAVCKILDQGDMEKLTNTIDDALELLIPQLLPYGDWKPGQHLWLETDEKCINVLCAKVEGDRSYFIDAWGRVTGEAAHDYGEEWAVWTDKPTRGAIK